MTSWAAFVDRFGYPVRLGKYGRKATREDVATLKRAVAAIGSDVGAVIPDSMLIDIVEAKTTSAGARVYQDLADWCDKQISKLVLGQTASADGQPGALGNQKGQEEVRQDIIDADATQLEQTLNRDLVEPYVKLNFGLPTEGFPRLVLRRADETDIKLVVESVATLGAIGLKVKAEEIRNLLGLSKPDEGDETIGGIPPAMAELPPDSLAANAEAPFVVGEFSVDAAERELMEEAEEQGDFVAIGDDIAQVLEEAAQASKNFTEFKAKLGQLVVGWPPEKIAELVAVTTFKARALGDVEFED